ncbi:MAG: 7-cyano-7-deazaguanine synthase [Alphaproteobacteria bacterium]|nr:7-cyano-7-deazaguanine synthase [Alphaproteobacteria bacterium]
MTDVIFLLDPQLVPSSPGNDIHVLLYGGEPVQIGTGAIGAQLRDEASRLGVQPTVAAMDFVSLALAVTAADTFVQRDDADNGWSREIHVVLPLHAPQPWTAVKTELEDALRFLSGDNWKFEFVNGGEPPPTRQRVRSRQRTISIGNVDLVSLFSGGLDSTISTIELLRGGKRPLLVSHAYRGDAQKQDLIAGQLPNNPQRFSVNAHPTWSGTSDVSMRTRSFNFIAFGVLAAQARSSFRNGVTELLMPENGLIALNAPLTPRRIGSLSTRTTHPHFLASVQAILTLVGLEVTIRNPYEATTKGEMVLGMASYPGFERIASETVSCGKWKRTNRQCGRCVPCLIRRASFYAGAVDDKTDYEEADLVKVMSDEDNRDDLVAMMTAVQRLATENIGRWAARAGPLPINAQRRSDILDVHRRGLTEVGNFLRDSGLPV